MKTASRHPLVIVALSGGVDSAVAAWRLRQAGQPVEALHMTNWDDEDGYCSAARDLRDARAVCRELDIPLHTVRFTREYRDEVFADFLAEYRAGRTPNPDVLCNRHIKFGHCLAHARRLGAAALATGHYARLEQRPLARLRRAADRAKDQSYFLHAVEPAVLGQVRFPLGDLCKDEVRGLAARAGLPVHAKRDSTGICFIGERPFAEFLGRYLEGPDGDIVTPAGRVVGRHRGLMFYTLGQRQGLGIGGRADAGDGAWYVADKDPARNRLVAVQGRAHPLLWSSGLVAGRPRWLRMPAGLVTAGGTACRVQVRYRAADVGCRIRLRADGGLDVDFDSPQWAVTPGQYAVFYAGDECLGGAVIEARRCLAGAGARASAVSA